MRCLMMVRTDNRKEPKMKLATLVAVAAVALGASTHARAADWHTGPASLADFNTVYNRAVSVGQSVGVEPRKTCGVERCDNFMVFDHEGWGTTIHNFIYFKNNVSYRDLCFMKKDDPMHDMCFDSFGAVWTEQYDGGNWSVTSTLRKSFDDQLASTDQGTM
jgi:hypothetical protein